MDNQHEDMEVCFSRKVKAVNMMIWEIMHNLREAHKQLSGMGENPKELIELSEYLLYLAERYGDITIQILKRK